MQAKFETTQLSDDRTEVQSKPGRENVWVQSQKHRFGYYETIGRRRDQEDALAWKIMDSNTLDSLTPVDIAYRLWTTYRLLDVEVCNNQYESGTTASTTVYDGRGNLITATLADAASFAAVYNTQGDIVGVTRLNSVTHKPTDPLEEKRIEEAGGFVINARVNDRLAVSRAIGDKGLKNAGVSSEANLDITNIEGLALKFNIKTSEIGSIQVITTCDGFTDGAGNNKQTKKDHEEYLLNLLRQKSPTGTDEASLSLYLAEGAITGGSSDNVSVSVQTIIPETSVTPIFQGVYDGHAGSEVAHCVAMNVARIFTEQCTLSNECYAAQPLSVNNNKDVFNRDNAHLESSLPVIENMVIVQLLAQREKLHAESLCTILLNHVENKEITREKLLPFLEQLDRIDEKKDKFVKNKNRAAEQAISTLELELRNALGKYLTNKVTYTPFKEACESAIDKARPILEHHRGWKEVFINVLLAVAGLLPFLINVAINTVKGKPTFFVANATKPDAAKIIDLVAEKIEDMNPNPAPKS